jgi:hypothetical protein
VFPVHALVWCGCHVANTAGAPPTALHRRPPTRTIFRCRRTCSWSCGRSCGCEHRRAKASVSSQRSESLLLILDASKSFCCIECSRVPGYILTRLTSDFRVNCSRASLAAHTLILDIRTYRVGGVAVVLPRTTAPWLALGGDGGLPALHLLPCSARRASVHFPPTCTWTAGSSQRSVRTE